MVFQNNIAVHRFVSAIVHVYLFIVEFLLMFKTVLLLYFLVITNFMSAKELIVFSKFSAPTILFLAF